MLAKIPLFVLALAFLTGTAMTQATLLSAYGSPHEKLGTTARMVGDVDGDGLSDLVVASRGTPSENVAPSIKVLSGATGATIHLWANQPANTGVAACGDFNLDGTPDVLIGSNPVTVRSGGNGFALQQFPLPGAGVLGESLACLGDVDADGVPDVALSAFNAGQVVVFSGATAQLLYAVTVRAQNEAPEIAVVADVDGDGISEFLASVESSNLAHTAAKLYSGATGALIYDLSSMGSNFGSAVCDAGDVTGDGITDLAVGARNTVHPVRGTSEGAVYIYSGASGALVSTIYSPSADSDNFGRSLTNMGDINQDGVPDLAVGATLFSAVIISGATGTDLMRAAVGGQSLDRVPDRNQDGVDELLGSVSVAGNTAINQGSIQIVSGEIFAGVTSLPVSCANGPLLPELFSSRPRLGATAQLLLRYALPGATALLVGGQPVPVSLNLGFPGCESWVDPAAAVVLGGPQVIPATGEWGPQLAIPMIPQLAGAVFNLQVIVLPTFGPLGYDLSNGLSLRLGS